MSMLRGLRKWENSSIYISAVLFWRYVKQIKKELDMRRKQKNIVFIFSLKRHFYEPLSSVLRSMTMKKKQFLCRQKTILPS